MNRNPYLIDASQPIRPGNNAGYGCIEKMARYALAVVWVGLIMYLVIGFLRIVF
jgi:hypothetical protein